ncbi:hypothetical protein ACFS07_04005 [Undibacterium arcticum]
MTGCGGGADGYAQVVVDTGPVPVPVAVQPTYEYLRHPTISGLEYFNSVTGSESHLTTAAGGYVGYTGGDIVTFWLGDIVLFTMPGGTWPSHFRPYMTPACTRRRRSIAALLSKI